MVPLFIFRIKSVQRNFTRFVCNKCNISNTSYKDRLVRLRLEPLENRRWQFDLMTLSLTVNGKCKEFFNQFFVVSQTNYNLRGNDKIIKCKYNFNNNQ